MSGGGGGGGTTRTEPPRALKQPFNDYGSLLTQFMGDPGTAFAQYQGQTLAQNSPYGQQAISALANPAPWAQAQNYYGDVASGQYLGLNPQLQQAVINPAIQGVNASFNQLGRFGSPENQARSSEAAIRALMPYYDSERQRQGQAAALLPSLAQGQAGAYQQAAGLEQQMGQRDINEQMAQFYQQNYNPQYAALQAYGGLLSPGSQYSIQTSTPQSGSSIAGGIGGALLGSAASPYLAGAAADAGFGSLAVGLANPWLLPLLGAGAGFSGLLG